MSRILFALLALSLLTACSSFNGPGRWKPPSDYSQRTSNRIAPSEFKFSLTKPVKRYRLTQRFAPPSNPRHDGIDLAARRGTPIYASHDGKVVYRGRKYRGYGKMILLEYNKTWATLYAHLDQYLVKPGQRIKKGQLIGRMGRTGRTTGVHLHFELLKNKVPVDPIRYMPSFVTLYH